jgi:threonyl-tRNA synthetase
MLILHVDYFRCTITKRGRSKIVEDPPSKTTEVEEALLVLASVEKQDEANPEDVSGKAVKEIAKLGHQLKVNTIVLHPFAHLFGELSKPEAAIETLKLTEEGLVKRGFKVARTPFGWFNALELRAKGHPLSRVARKVSVN